MKQAPIDYLKRASTLANLFQARDLREPDICLLVSLKLFPHIPACGIGIFELSKEGTYTLNATFGLTEDAQQAWANGCITEDSPVVEAMRTSEVVCICTKDEMIERYPIHSAKHEQASLTSVIAVPIRRMGLTIGAFAVIGSDVKVNDECARFLEIVAGLISLKLEVQADRSAEASSQPVRPERSPELTKRQLLVQSMMSEGKTNAQIADELGYSESTIRQDAVSMFIKLGVKNRRDAGQLFSPDN